MIDIGANLTHYQFEQDLDSVILRAQNHDIDHIIVTGTELTDSSAAIELCRTYPGYLSCTAGIHPHQAKQFDEKSSVELLTALAQTKCVVAIGETGLDFYRDFSPRIQQRRSFEHHLELARELNLPVFIHDRDSHGEMHSILSNYHDVQGVIHCFTGSTELLKQYLDLDFYIGITGWICDERRGVELQQSVRYIPNDRLLIETDAPYLTPRTMSKKSKRSRNEPCNLKYVLDSLAQHRQQSIDDLQKLTIENARRLFAIPEQCLQN